MNNQQTIYKDRQNGQWVYWVDNHDTGGKTFLKEETVLREARKSKARIVELVR